VKLANSTGSQPIVKVNAAAAVAASELLPGSRATSSYTTATRTSVSEWGEGCGRQGGCKAAGQVGRQVGRWASMAAAGGSALSAVAAAVVALTIFIVPTDRHATQHNTTTSCVCVCVWVRE